MMRKYGSMAAWEAARSQEPWLDGVSLQKAARLLPASEQELGELLLKGTLSVSYIHENGEVVKAVIPLGEIQAHMRRNRAPFVGERKRGWKSVCCIACSMALRVSFSMSMDNLS